MTKILVSLIFTLIFLNAYLILRLSHQDSNFLSPLALPSPFGNLLGDSPRRGLSPKSPNLEGLKEDLEKTTREHEGTYGIFVKDLRSSQAVGVNEDETFYAASLLKVPIMMAVYKEVERGNLNLEEKLIFTKKDFEGGDGSIQHEAFGTGYSLKELLTRMIKESDNVARRMLTRRIGYKVVWNLIRDLEIEDYDLQNNRTTAKAISSIFEHLYKSYQNNGRSSKEMVYLLTETKHEERIPEPLPSHIRVAHKIGTWPKTGSWHDCGIIFTENPYLLCILSKNTTYKEALLVTHQISTTVYNYLTTP